VEGIYYPGYDLALRAYCEDQVDMVSMWNADPETVALALAAHHQELVQIPQLSTFYLSFRADRPPFEDPGVRKAFIMAINRGVLVQEGFGGQRLPAFGGFLPPGMPGHLPEIGLAYNPEGARRALAQAGFPSGDGFPEINWLHVSGGEGVIRFLQAAWKEHLGLDLQPQSLDWDAFLQRLDQDPPDLWLSGWTADFPDPDCMLRVTFHSEQGVSGLRWKNLSFDGLVQQAGEIIDDRLRIDLYQQADRILVADDAVVMPLTYGTQRMLVKPWITLPGALSIQMPLNHLVLNRA
jgi:oligopeptide transport system substrate-binding protein